MRTKCISMLIAPAGLAAIAPGAASAQDAASPIDMAYGTTQSQEDELPWGLLGLLALAGLLGLKRRDDNNRVDNRTRP